MYIIQKIYSKAMCFGSIMWWCCICVCFPFLQDRVLLLSWPILSGLTLQRTCWILCRTGPQSQLQVQFTRDVLRVCGPQARSASVWRETGALAPVGGAPFGDSFQGRRMLPGPLEQ